MRKPHAPWWKGKRPARGVVRRGVRVVRALLADRVGRRLRDLRVRPDARPAPGDVRADQALGAGRHAAEPPTRPPVVTGDPAPPAAPPVTPVVVPGDPVRDPGPTAARERRSATPRRPRARARRGHPRAPRRRRRRRPRRRRPIRREGRPPRRPRPRNPTPTPTPTATPDGDADADTDADRGADSQPDAWHDRGHGWLGGLAGGAAAGAGARCSSRSRSARCWIAEFFQSWGWLAGPGAWAACALFTGAVLKLPLLAVLAGAALAGMPSLIGVLLDISTGWVRRSRWRCSPSGADGSRAPRAAAVA